MLFKCNYNLEFIFYASIYIPIPYVTLYFILGIEPVLHLPSFQCQPVV